MRAERRGRVIRVCWVVNRRVAGGAGERAEAEGASRLRFPSGLSGRPTGRSRPTRGAAGVDGESIAEFEKDLKGNLYKLWNRLSSGSYFPPPVRAVEIPKTEGKGSGCSECPPWPTGSPRRSCGCILEPEVEPMFHPDSYGYRPGRSALDAVATCRQRCWKNDWVIDLDIRAFFDSLDHDLVMRTVSKHTDLRWVLLYVERWLKAPLQREDGTLVATGSRDPAGLGDLTLAGQPVLALRVRPWMAREFPAVPFERYCDDAVVHCGSERQAQQIRDAIAERMAQVGLELHPDKTRIVYCKDGTRRGSHEHEQFDFLGYTFRPRLAKSRRGDFFVSFLPAVSDDAAKAIRQEIRRWRLHQRSDKPLTGPCPDGQPDRARVDQLLRALLQVRRCIRSSDASTST